MIALLKTYIDIAALRKGPDAIPASWLMLVIAVGLLGITFAIQFALFRVPAAGISSVLYAYASEILVYVAAATLLGFSSRLRQMLSAIIACGALIALFSVAVRILAQPFFGPVAANALAVLTFFWAVPVKGHIVARTLEKHWFIGIAIAMIAFLLRFGVETSLLASQQGGAS